MPPTTTLEDITQSARLFSNMLSFHLPLDLDASSCQEYCLQGTSESQATPPFQLRISMKRKCLDLCVDSNLALTWKPELPTQDVTTAANSDTADVLTPETVDADTDGQVARGPPLSYELQEFNTGGCLQANSLHTMCEGPARFFKLMVLIDNYLRPHSLDGEGDNSSLSLPDRWSTTFPKAVQVGHDIISELTKVYSAPGGDIETRVFISNLAAKVYQRAKEWIEDLWVGEVDQYQHFSEYCEDRAVNFEEDFYQASMNARNLFQLAALECDLAECMISIDNHDDYPELLINIAVWISQFDGPTEHLMAYVREVAHAFAGESNEDRTDSIRLRLMTGMRMEIMHLIRCRIFKSILLKEREWLGCVDGTMFANILRCGAMDFHCTYASRMCQIDEGKAFSFLRDVAMAGCNELIQPNRMRILLSPYTLEELMPRYDGTKVTGAPVMDLDELWSTSNTVEELSWRFAKACKSCS